MVERQERHLRCKAEGIRQALQILRRLRLPLLLCLQKEAGLNHVLDLMDDYFL